MLKSIALMIAVTLLCAAPGPVAGRLPRVAATQAVSAASPDGRLDLPAASAAVVTQAVVETKLTAATPTAGATFGQTVAIDGDWAVIGAPGDLVGGVRTGAAYVFRFNGTSWAQAARLTASDAGAGDVFGQAVAIDGGVIVVGASGDDEAGFNSGAAYVFRFDGSNWLEEAKLLPNSPSDLSFGRTVAVDGDRIAVGTPFSYIGGTSTNSGSAYIFQRSGGSWAQVVKFATRTGGAVLSDTFGWAVALSGDTLVVGAYLANAAYVYDWNGSSWTRSARLSGGDTAAGDRFGYAVAVDGDTLAVGAVEDDDAGNNSGSAYVFQSGGTGWIQQAKLTPGGVMTGARFGWSVALQGGMLVVGARESKGEGDRTEAGAAYAYARSGDAWSLSEALFANDAASGDHFGASVAFDSGVALVGAPDKDGGGLEAGAAYVYSGLPSGGGDDGGGGGGGGGDDGPLQPCEMMMAEDEGAEAVAAGVNLTWASAFRCVDAPDQGRYKFTVVVSNSAASGASAVVSSLNMTHTTPRPLGKAPDATFQTDGLPLTVAPGESGTFTVGGTYTLVSTDEGSKANLHFCASGQAQGEAFYLGLNALLRGPGASEEDEDTDPPVITNISVTPAQRGATVKWTTDEPASSRVAYGQGLALSLAASRGCGAAAAAHQVELGGLLPGAAYSYRVESRDGAGNLAVSETAFFTTRAASLLTLYIPLVVR